MQLQLYLFSYWIYTQQKLLHCHTVQHSDVNMIQRSIESCFFLFRLEKDTVVKQWIHNCGQAGWKPTRYARLCLAHFEESRFEVDIFSSTNWSRSSKTSATENVKA